MKRGLILAAVHMAMVLAVGAKLSLDRSQLPRVWVRAVPYDPSTPLRGRYVSLALEVEPAGYTAESRSAMSPCRLEAGDHKLRCIEDAAGTHQLIWGNVSCLQSPVLFFIPEHIPNPSIRAVGEELWVEVTVPNRGKPRPIRLGVKKAGQLTPLAIN